MLKNFRAVDSYTKNIAIVFFGSFLGSFLNLLCQLLVAHKLIPEDFAAFNSLLAIYILASSPLATLQTALAKYVAEFNSRGETDKVKALLSGFLKHVTLFSLVILLVSYFAFTPMMLSLKIGSSLAGYILIGMLALSWFTPVAIGGLQGLELFKWFSASSIVSGIVKLLLTFIFIIWGYNISGALGAFLISVFCSIGISYIPLRRLFSLEKIRASINYQEIYQYLFPIAISIFCFNGLFNIDMILVRYFFSTQDSGIYSLAQMVGKIFLFLPSAISVVLLPRTSHLSAKKINTLSVLNRSILCGAILCLIAVVTYNLFPGFMLKILTGKALPEAILLGRLFSISMSFFALLFILITYFLSKKDLRFIKYLVIFTLAQAGAIVLFHRTLVGVQIILCVNAVLLFTLSLRLAYNERH